MIFKKLVLIDGINRAGKNSIVDAITSFRKSESIEMNYILEHIVEGAALKLISLNFAKSFFSKFLNEIAYNKMISRNANFRKNDKSSIFNFSFPKVYQKRLLIKKEGENIFSKLKKTKNFFPFMTHEVLANVDVLDKLKIDYKMIAIFRNPFDLIFSWHKKKVVKKFGDKNFTLTFVNKNKIYPWYVYNNHKKWAKLNDIDKISFIVINLINLSKKKYRKSKNKKNIFLIKYEEYVNSPFIYLKKISKFLNTDFSSQTKKRVKRLKLPIDLNKLDNQREKKINYLKKKISPKLFSEIENLEKNYNKNFYGLK